MKNENDFHTPEEILKAAEFLLSLEDPKAIRASVIEAEAALETYVYEIVFSKLKRMMDPILVNWLESKSKMDFDARITVFTEAATGLKVDRQSQLWNHYTQIRKIRTNVVHSTAKISRTDARFVINTVYEWIDYLSSAKTAEDIPVDKVSKELLAMFFAKYAILERILYNFLKTITYNGNHFHDRNVGFFYLLKWGVIDQKGLLLLQETRKLRNVLAHESADQVKITQNEIIDAIEYIDQIEPKLVNIHLPDNIDLNDSEFEELMKFLKK